MTIKSHNKIYKKKNQIYTNNVLVKFVYNVNNTLTFILEK